MTTHDAITVVPVDGDIDLNTSADIVATIYQAVRPGPPVVVIDMTEVSFLSATGLSVLVATKEETRKAGIELRLVASRREVLRPLQITGLTADFDIYPTVAEAEGGGRHR
jgi:anti-sigma B factor antagonist